MVKVDRSAVVSQTDDAVGSAMALPLGQRETIHAGEMTMVPSAVVTLIAWTSSGTSTKTV